MPKDALVLNGFGGGINKDNDATDLVAKGDSTKDEVRTADNIFLDYRGKIVLEYPTSVANAGIAGTTGITIDSDIRDDTAESALIFGGELYQNTGLYKMEDIVSYSGDLTRQVYPPSGGGLVTALPSVSLPNGIEVRWTVDRGPDGLDATNDGPYVNMFIGEDFKTGHAAEALLVGSYTSLDNPGHLVRHQIDIDSTGTTWTYEEFNDFECITDIPGLIGRYYSNDNDQGGYTGMVQVALCKDDSINFATSSLGGGSGTWTHNTTYLDLWGAEDSSVPGGDPGTSSLIDISGAHEFQWYHYGLAYSRILSGGYNSATTKYGEDHNSSSILWFNISKSEEIKNNAGVVVAYTGPYGEVSTDLKDKYIEVEFKLNETAAIIQKIDRIYIVADTHENNYKLETYFTADAYCKVWTISVAEWRNKKDSDGYAYFRIPVSAFSYEGGSYVGDHSVRRMGITYDLSGNVDPANSQACFMQLRCFALVPAQESAWAGSEYYKLFQTVVKNGIESLPSSMGDPRRVYDDANQFVIGQPLIPSHATSVTSEGKVYWQASDEDGNLSGEMYLLAHYDYTKGVRWGGDTDEKWINWSEGVSNRLYKTFNDPPLTSTFTLETGYPDNTKTINAFWNTATTIGKQVYIANVLLQDPLSLSQNDNFDGIASESAGGMVNGVVTTTGLNDNMKMHFVATDSKIRWGETNAGDGSGADNGPLFYNWLRCMNLAAGDKFMVMHDHSDNDNVGKLFTVDSVGTGNTAGSGGSHQIVVDETVVDYTGVAYAKTIVKFKSSYETSRILKTPIGNQAGFPDSMYLDLEFSGDSIQVIESSGDRVLIFSLHQLTIINVAQEIEYIEATFDHMGVTKHRQVCKIGEGVAFVNSSGVFFFNGQEIMPLSSEKLITEPAWNDATSAIVYDAHRDLLWVWVANDDIWFYSFVNQSWIGHSTRDDGNLYKLPETNSVGGPYGYTHYIKSDDSAHHTLAPSISTSGDDVTFKLTTGKIGCGNFSRRKRFYKAYITHKGTDGTVDVDFTCEDPITTVNKNTSPTTLAPYSSGYTTELVLPNDSGDASGKWIVFEFESSNASSDWEISDISIIYREKTVR